MARTCYLFVRSIFRNFFYPPKYVVVSTEDETLFPPTFLKTAAENHLIPPTTVYAKAFVAAMNAKAEERSMADFNKQSRAASSQRAREYGAELRGVTLREPTVKRICPATGGLPPKKMKRAELKEEFKKSLPKALLGRQILLEAVQEGITELQVAKESDDISVDDM